MPADLVRVRLESGAEVSLGRGYAERKNLEVLSKPATRNGRTLPTKHPVDLRGKALDAALVEAGLPTTGKAEEKRQRLADHQASVEQLGGEVTTNPVGESDTSEEDSK